MWIYLSKGKIEVPKDIRNSKSGNMTSSEETGLNIRMNASQNGTGLGVRRRKCPLLTCSTHCGGCMETSRKSVNG